LRHLRESAVPSIGVLSSISAAARTPIGGILENQVAVDLLRSFEEIYGWKKSSSGTEIDFVIKQGGTGFPLECKATTSINRRHLKGVADYLAFYSLQKGYIVSFAPRSVLKVEGREIHNIPAYFAECIDELVDR